MSATERGDREYAVRLLWAVDAPDPVTAVRMAVSQMAEHGIVHWVFRVTDTETEEFLLMNGKGELAKQSEMYDDFDDFDDDAPDTE